MQTPQKPNFLIIGAAKCGTTSLAAILDNHPECCMSRPKEANFFNNNKQFTNFNKGWDWYSNFFNHYSGESCIGEASPTYSEHTFSPQTVERIYQFNPDFNIIYQVRDPLERQISAWKMQYAFGLENRYPKWESCKWALKGFDFWMEQQRQANQWDKSLYNLQINAFKKYFNNENILISFLEDWISNQTKELQKICKFLSINNDNVTVAKPTGHNRAIDRKIERPLLKIIKDTIPIQQQNKIPFKSTLARLYKFISQTNYTTPEANINAPIVSDFINFIHSDSTNFLAAYKKPASFWPSLTHTKSF